MTQPSKSKPRCVPADSASGSEAKRSTRAACSPLGVAVCIPTGARVPADFWPRVLSLQEMFKLKGCECNTLRVSGCSLLEQARSMLATQALKTGADVTLWIDDDIVFNPSELVRMTLLAPEKGIIGAAASTRSVKGRTNVEFLRHKHTIRFYEGGDVYEVGGIGLGATAISREVYEAIGKAFPHLHVMSMHHEPMVAYFHSAVANSVWHGEDMTFCLRAREAGFKIYLDSRVRLGHVGDYEYTLENTMGEVPILNTIALNVESRE